MRHLAPLVVFLVAGCSFTTMTPAHKLDKGQIVTQGAVDQPGFLFIPRMSGQFTVGTGGADFGLHAGTALLTLNGGVTARAYLGKAALSLQADGIITTFEDTLLTGGTHYGVMSITPRLGRLLESHERFYYGAQIQGILPFNIEDAADLPSGPGFAVGAYFGWAWDTRHDIDFQLEVSASPIAIFPDIYTVSGNAYGVGPAPIGQVGFGVQYRREKEGAPARPTPEEPAPRAPTDNRIL